MANFDHFNKGKNSYFDFRNPAYDRDKQLFGLLATEAFNKFGTCMEFYQSTYDVSFDRIFGEDNNRRFVNKFEIMVYYQLPTEEKMWSSFGIQNMDTFSMYCSKRHFRAVTSGDDGEYIPKIGDIIMAKYAPNIYEITEIAEEVSMFLQSKEHMWEFVVSEYKDEHISVSGDVSATAISAYTDKDEDIFDISSVVDVEKEEILYTPTSAEKGSGDPWGNWN